MKSYNLLLAGMTAGLLITTPVSAIPDTQFEAIRNMGDLNGVALPCGYIKQAQRIKQALVANLPKRRALGEAFDTITNESYLKFVEQGRDCPGETLLSQQIDEAIKQLESVFQGD